MRLDIIQSHIKKARNANTSFDKFEALWAAFNVMYEAKRTDLISESNERNPNERNIAKYCAGLLPYDSWIDLFPSQEMSNLFRIAPIFNVRDFLRKGEISTNEFDRLLELNLEDNTGDIHTDIIKLNALVDLLYIVRCNKAHGFKTIDIPRDVEVLDLTTPLLEILVKRLFKYFSENEEGISANTAY